MKNRSVIALLVVVLLFGAAPAYADPPFTGNARAVGLTLQLQGEGLTAALSEAKVQATKVDDGCAEDVKACAAAAGLAEPFGRTVRASAPGNGGPNTEAAAPIVNLDLGDSPLGRLLTAQRGQAVAAATAPPTTTAKADAAEDLISLNLGQQATQLQGLMKSELPGIAQELFKRAETEGGPTGMVGRVAEGLQTLAQDPGTAPLLKVAIGPSSSVSTDDQGKTISTASVEGAKIVVGPATPSAASAREGLIRVQEGLVVIRVGRSLATATSDRRSATASFTPAQVTVLSQEGPGSEETTMSPGQAPQCFAEETPLRTCIAVGSGAKTEQGAGAAATAAGVRISVGRMTNAPGDEQGVLELQIAKADAGVNAAPGAVPAGPAPAPNPSRQLPATGGTDLALPALALLGASGLGLVALRRRR